MTTETRQEVMRNWSYFNVLEMLVAVMPAGDYTPDIGVWTRVVKRLQEEYKDRCPELLGDVYFIERDPLDPYSPEVEEFFQRIALTVYNPDFEKMVITKPKQDILRRRAKKRLAQEFVDVIQEMGKSAAKELEIEQPKKVESC